MNRRRFLKQAGAGAGVAALAAPAIVRAQPTIQWRLTSSFPKSLDTLFGAGDHDRQRGRRDDRRQVPDPPFAAGEIVPGLQVLDAVSNGTVECGHTTPTTTSARTRPSASTAAAVRPQRRASTMPG